MTLERHDVTEIRESSPSQLATLERGAGEAAARLIGLGVQRATRMNPPAPGEPGQVLISLGGGARSDYALVHELVEARANAKVKKLAAASDRVAADRVERHLFVWVTSGQGDAELTIATQPPPDVTPSIPDAIDVVWAATAAVAWRLRPPGGWEVVRWSV